jgi:hypothetical protein
MLDGNTSLLDWLAFTWSFGWICRPRRSLASVASTSFMFMLLLVPDPVWNTSIGNSPFHRPDATSAAAADMASATSSSTTPSSALTAAAAALIRARAAIWAASSGVPLMGKFSTARWVCARYFAAFGTYVAHRVALAAELSHGGHHLPRAALERGRRDRSGT